MISLLLCYRRFIGLTMVLTLLCPLLLALLNPVPLLAQAAPPPECRDDRGNVLDPQRADAWLLVLNFNHPPSTQVTTGCVVYRFASQPQPIYRLIDCPLRNNLQGIKVGGGTAEFDGNFWIECLPPAGFIDLKDFGIRATAHFVQPAAAYTLVDHPSVSLSAWVTEDWRLHLDSRYGTTSFSHATNAPSALQPVVLLSHVQQMVGQHAINGAFLQPAVTVAAFGLDAASVFRISDQGQHWSLAELLIDPPGYCSSGCG